MSLIQKERGDLFIGNNNQISFSDIIDTHDIIDNVADK